MRNAGLSHKSQAIIQSGGRARFWLKRSSAAAAAVADAAARTSVVIDSIFLGGTHRWRAQEMDVIVIRCKDKSYYFLKPENYF